MSTDTATANPHAAGLVSDSGFVSLCDGTRVPDADPRWAAECLRRQRHVEALRGLDLAGRREYFANVRDREGPEAHHRLQLRYAQDWEERRAAARRAQTQLDTTERVRMA